MARKAVNPIDFDKANLEHVKILDYGQRGIENLLTKYGDRVEKLLLSLAKTLT